MGIKIIGLLKGGIKNRIHYGASFYGVLIVALLFSYYHINNNKLIIDLPHKQERSNLNLIALGKNLFNLKLLSKDGTIACSSCHVPKLGFSGSTPKAIGVGGLPTKRRAPTLIGLNNESYYAWDGRTSSLVEQISIPLDSNEMETDWSSLEHYINNITDSIKVNGLKRPDVVRLLKLYVLSINDARSRFDRFFDGGDQNALTAREKEGYRIFVRKAGCASCHLINSRTRDFTDRSFHNIGTGTRTHDIGRAAVTGKQEDKYKFKTPSLRGVAMRTAFMHDGSMKSLEEVLLYYNSINPTSEDHTIDSRLNRLFLKSDEIGDLIAFLETLTPEQPMD